MQARAFVTDSDKLDVSKETSTDFGYFKDQPIGMKKFIIKDFQLTKHQEKELELVSVDTCKYIMYVLYTHAYSNNICKGHNACI